MQMVIDERGAALAAHELISGHSPADGARHAHDTTKLKAHTFDWWIPIKPPFSLDVPLERTEHSLRGLGHTTTTADIGAPRLAADRHPAPDPAARFGRTSDVAFEVSVPKLSFVDGTEDWEGE